MRQKCRSVRRVQFNISLYRQNINKNRHKFKTMHWPTQKSKWQNYKPNLEMRVERVALKHTIKLTHKHNPERGTEGESNMRAPNRQSRQTENTAYMMETDCK